VQKLTLLILACALVLSACTAKEQKSPEQLKQDTAAATAKLKSNAKAVVEGVREGLKNGSTATLVDLNKASRADIRALPGMTDAATTRVLNGRPYDTPSELVSRNILSQAQYDQIKDRVEVNK
jgi:competence protein ComEA